MVPSLLAVRNFLCYRDCPPIDFGNIHVACLTGENGNGKSALLDAITWALWGKARAKSDGDLVTLGQGEMEVEFAFWAGDARYRVLRKYRRVGARGSGQSALELQIRDGEGWRAISGSTQAETQRKILDVIKLSYDTFVNSSFLVQGRADAFTVKSPGERKEVLGEILDLSRYDQYEARAKERRNECARAVDMLERQVHDAEVELVRLPQHRQAWEQDRRELDDVAADLTRETLARDALRAARHTRDSLLERLIQAQRDRDQGMVDLTRAEDRAAATRQTIDRCLAIVDGADAIRAGYQALGDARERLQAALSQRDRLASELSGLAQARDDAQAELDRAEQQTASHQADVIRYEDIVADAGVIHDGFARLQVARAQLSEQDRRLGAQRRLHREMQPLRDALIRVESEQRARLDALRRELESRVQTAARLDTLPRARAAAERTRAELDAMTLRLGTVRSEASDLRGEIAALQARNLQLRSEIDELKRKFDELKAAVERGDADCPLCRSHLGHDGLRGIEETYQADGRNKQGQFVANRRRIQELEADAQARAEEGRRLEADLSRRQSELTRRITELDSQIAEAEEAAAWVEQARPSMDALEAAIMSGDFAQAERAELAALQDQSDRVGYDEAAHQQARDAIEALQAFEARHAELDRAQTALGAARNAFRAAEDSAARSRRRRDEAAGRIVDIQSRIASLPVASLEAELDSLRPFEDRYEALRDAEARLAAARAALDSDNAAVAGARRQRDAALRAIEDIEARLGELPDVAAQLPAFEERVRLLEERTRDLHRAIASSETEIQRLEEMERRTETRRRQLDEVRRELSVYDELVLAFGKRGVQALLIEAVLPEIEEAANELLARMTSNRMHVALETQRQTLKGTVQETLEIKIADEWGTRSYEMFSGGEAFRINLALRIALSKLLARRAGAPLATLVIDEGFGTQDAAGRERLVEAITAIQDHFQCLLLVTHIDELKDLFETRIEVTRSGDGAVARVVAA